jgi:hypothetical protein
MAGSSHYEAIRPGATPVVVGGAASQADCKAAMGALLKTLDTLEEK